MYTNDIFILRPYFHHGIGVAILEEDQSAVPDFVEEMGDKMDYRA